MLTMLPTWLREPGSAPVHNLLLVDGGLLLPGDCTGLCTELHLVSLSSFTCHGVIFDLYPNNYYIPNSRPPTIHKVDGNLSVLTLC